MSRVFKRVQKKDYSIQQCKWTNIFGFLSMPKENRNGNDPKNNVHIISCSKQKHWGKSKDHTGLRSWRWVHSALDKAHSPLPRAQRFHRQQQFGLILSFATTSIFNLTFLLSNPHSKIKTQTQPFSCFSPLACFGETALLRLQECSPHLHGLHLNLLSPSSSPMLIVWLQFYLSTSVCIYKHISTYLSTYHKHSLSFLTLIIWLQFLKRL